MFSCMVDEEGKSHSVCSSPCGFCSSLSHACNEWYHAFRGWQGASSLGVKPRTRYSLRFIEDEFLLDLGNGDCNREGQQLQGIRGRLLPSFSLNTVYVAEMAAFCSLTRLMESHVARGAFSTAEFLS